MTVNPQNLPPAIPPPDGSPEILCQRLGMYVARCHQLEEVLVERAGEANRLHDNLLSKQAEVTALAADRDRLMAEVSRLSSELNQAIATLQLPVVRAESAPTRRTRGA